MVDFKKRLGDRTKLNKKNPIEIYDSSDRTSEAGPLRPARNIYSTNGILLIMTRKM